MLSEDGLIERFFAPLAGPGGLGLRDDAAVLQVAAGCELVLTKDALVADVHFFRADPPADIARKALRTNLSDLAAKGAQPLGFLLALALPNGWSVDWLAEFSRGLGEDAKAFAIPLLGGDTVRTPGPLMVCITALGQVPKGAMVRRTGVRVGERLYVSGTIGDAALGLRIRLSEPRDLGWIHALSPTARAFLLERYLLPRPRNRLAPVLGEHASGGMDISDGFVGDLTKMLSVSGVGARIQLPSIPFSAAVQEGVAVEPTLTQLALTGGDDYEILCSVALDKADAFELEAKRAGVDVTFIGMAGQGDLAFVEADGRLRTFQSGSFSHF